MALNPLCSSGLQAIVTTAQNILLGDCDFGIGVEVMSRGAYIPTAIFNGSLVAIHAAARQLQGDIAKSVAVLADKNEMVLFVEGDDVHPTRVFEHVIRGLRRQQG